MGYELRRDLREVLGPEITGLQRAVALEIADDANEGTRKSWVKLEDLARWTGAKDTSVVRNALKRLAAAGWEFRVPIGKGKDGRAMYAVPGTRMTFRVPDFEGVATATPSDEQGGAPAPSEGAPATPLGAQGGAGAHSEGATAPSEGAVAPPFSSYSSAPQEVVITTPAQGVATATPSRAASTPPPRDYHMDKFTEAWLLYPRSVQPEKAKRAWREAIDRGADPAHIVAAAQAYAHARADEDAAYTPYFATWLNDGSYDDPIKPKPSGKPNVRAVDGKGRPGGVRGPLPTADEINKLTLEDVL
jgi:hypothetical protein